MIKYFGSVANKYNAGQRSGKEINPDREEIFLIYPLLFVVSFGIW